MSLPSSHLRIVATSDIHMHLVGWDALRDVPLPRRGMDRLASLIRHERETAKGGVVLFDNGDVLQGAPMGDLCLDIPEDHPWPAILNALAYDAVGLGNHDFDFGQPYLERVSSQIRCPILCANMTPGSVAQVVQSTLLDRELPCSDGHARPLRIGVTSVLPPQTAVWNQRCLDGSVGFAAGVDATRTAVNTLRQAGADIVIVLCHSGLTDGFDTTGENFGASIAADVPGIDALILGHTHLRFPGPDHAGFAGVHNAHGTVHNVPSVMPGHAAQELGVIDLELVQSNQTWQVTNHTVRRRSIDENVVPDAEIAQISAPLVARTHAHLNHQIGTAATHLHSWFSMLQPSRAEALVARALTNTIAGAVKGTDLATLPLLASVAPAAMGGRAGADAYVDIPPGAFRERHVAMLCPYPNTIWARVLTGAELWDWIDRSLVFFAPATGDGAPLVDADAPAFNFDTVHGVEAMIDPFAPAAFDVNGHRTRHDVSRVKRLTYAGQHVQPEARFVLAMTSYRGAGGGNFPGIGPQTRTVRTQTELRDAIRTEIACESAHLSASNAAAWQFAPSRSQRRVIQTSPAAAPFLADIARFTPRSLGLDDNGFLQVEVTV